MNDDHTEFFGDSELLEKLAENLDNYFHLLVAKYEGRIFMTAYMLLDNVEDAEDVAVDTFVKAAEFLKKKPSDISLLPWLLTIVRNCCNNHRRFEKRLKRPPHSVSLDEQGVREFIEGMPFTQHRSAEQEAIRSESLNELHLLLERLPSRQRAVVILHFGCGLTYPQIVDILNRSPEVRKLGAVKLETIKREGSRGLEKLRELAHREGNTSWLERLITSVF